ncbi:MAG: molybdenum cofactor synthesis domain [Actinomycetia bacterium]|nr:molybdenum cofactor synthesis domain [Actinomycetes bacterium]
MITLTEAQSHILGAVGVLEPVVVPIGDALGLVNAVAVTAAESVPPFANSAMDGYAVRAADVEGATDGSPVPLRVVAELPAGRAPTVPVGRGEAIRIMTGAPMPDGADAIVMVEQTRPGDDGNALTGGTVLIGNAAVAGDHVRAAGGDVRPGDVVVEAGVRLRPAHLGVLASVGRAEVTVFPRARVGVLSTGDELVGDGSALAPGQIRDSNRPMLLALLRELGAEALDLGSARDDETVIADAIGAAVDRCDAVITSGGVSVGDYDAVKVVLNRLAPGSMHWWQVAIKPAKPLAFGVVRGVPVFGLPGNPVSSLVSFELFARPALLRMTGHPDVLRSPVRMRAGAALSRRTDGKIHFVRVRVERTPDGPVAVSSGSQFSNALASMAAADGLAVLPDGPGCEPGDVVKVLVLGSE